MSGELINVVGILRDQGERYIFVYDDESAPDMFKQLIICAQDEELDFTLRDVEVLWPKVRKRAIQAAKERMVNVPKTCSRISSDYWRDLPEQD